MLRVQNFTVSSDGYGSGEGQSLDHPFGTANPGELMSWFFPTASFPGRPGNDGTRGIDELDDRFHHEQVASPTGCAVHHLYWRR